VDLFEPGSGSQVHDFNGGILQSGLFWTLRVPDDALRINQSGRRSELNVRDVGVVDSFQFASPLTTPATVSLYIDWRAIASPVPRGKGMAVADTDPGAFRGQIAAAQSTGWFSGRELGFAFRSPAASSTDRTYAQMGHERNGVFL
jgi:hypothetical protein